jgi:hypothetical protein
MDSWHGQVTSVEVARSKGVKTLSTSDRAGLVRTWLHHLGSAYNAKIMLRTPEDMPGWWSLKCRLMTEFRNRTLWYARYLEHLLFEADGPLLPPEHFKQSNSVRVKEYNGIRFIIRGAAASSIAWGSHASYSCM